MPRSKKEGWIDWVACAGRSIILEDLEPGGILDGQGRWLAEDLFRYYKTLPEFEKVVFSQFEARLISHRKQAKSARELADRDAQAMVHDRSLYTRLPYNGRGEQVFDMHPAKFLLRLDVKNKVHETMVPSAFQKTRPEYMVFKPKIFKHRIYQAVRLEKWLRFLSNKRAKERPAPPRSRTQFASQFASHPRHQGWISESD
jgi:hypothetical protein